MKFVINFTSVLSRNHLFLRLIVAICPAFIATSRIPSRLYRDIATILSAVVYSHNFLSPEIPDINRSNMRLPMPRPRYPSMMNTSAISPDL